MAKFTPTQGRYLAFIHSYTAVHGNQPAESEIAAAMRVSPPSVNQMMKTLEKKGLILRRPGQPRSVEILIPDDEVPTWSNSRQSSLSFHSEKPTKRDDSAPTAKQSTLYVVVVYLSSPPGSLKFGRKEISRTIEIRGDQTFKRLHDAIYKAFDRDDPHLYEFQFGKRPLDLDGPNYGSPELVSTGRCRNASKTTLDALNLTPGAVFGYLFDFGDMWYHRIRVERIDVAVAHVTYPRIIKRVGESPPQYDGE